MPSAFANGPLLFHIDMLCQTLEAKALMKGGCYSTRNIQSVENGLEGHLVTVLESQMKSRVDVDVVSKVQNSTAGIYLIALVA